MGVIPNDAIAVRDATSVTGLEEEMWPMNDGVKGGLEREMNYRVAMKIGEALCQKRLVTKAELRQIERKLLQKFSPVWSDIN